MKMQSSSPTNPSSSRHKRWIESAPTFMVLTIVFALTSIMSCDSGTGVVSSQQGAVAASPSPTPAGSNPYPYSNLKVSDPMPANLFVELAKKVNPTIVNISTSMRPRNPYPGLRGNGGRGGRDPFWDFFEDFMGPQGEGQDMQRPMQAMGTGFVIDQSGLIITNNHVIEQADEIKVQFVDDVDKFYSAEVIGSDQRTDVALIRVKVGHPLPVAELGTSEQVQVGDWVAAFGNPYGHTFSMSKGIISAKSRRIRDLNAVPFLQTDASINPGNSGGPLVDIHGRVIGVNAAIDARAQGIGFAIPIDHVKTILPQLREKGRVAYGFIGVESAPVTPRARQALRLPTEDGAIVMGIFPNGPADRGGLKAYDTIVEFNGKKVKDPQDLSDAVKDAPIGSKAPLVVIREGKKTNLNLSIGEPPRDTNTAMKRGTPPVPQGKTAPHNLGFKIVDYSDKIAKELGVSGPQKGPIIVDVSAQSTAAMNGLRVGDMILDVNRVKVKSANDVIKNITNGSNILRVAHGNRTSLVFIEVE